ncbi:MAG: Gldg family protein [Planctomycetota bacterium]|nr:Gldg family protein [Planctomycetota bacterium]
MRARSVASLVLDLVLGCAVVGVAVDVAEHMRGARVEVGRVRLGKLGEGTERFLESLQDRVFVTYYATSSGAMPSHLRQLELQVTDLLESMKDASGGMLDYQVIDPGSDPELADYAAKRKVAPVRVRHVTRDAYSEQEIWSTLETNYGPGAPAVIAGLESEHLPRLQHLLLEQLRAMESPRVPLFALAAREGFGDFRAWLSERGEVIDVDLDAGEPLPSAADVLFWMDPTPVDATRLDELDAFLDAGRSLVLAGGRHYAQFEDLGGLAAISMQPTGYVGNALWGHYGLGVFGELVLDERCQVLSDAGMMAPFRIICIANNQDFDSLAAEVNGSLMFELPNPFVMNGEALAAGGWLPEVLGTTSELTWTQASGSDAIALPLMSPEAGEPLPKQALIVWLRPEDPWRGSLMGLSSSSLFRDGMFRMQGAAHQRFAEILTSTLASSDRLALTRAEIARPSPLPALSPGSRAGWRLFCVGLVPVLLGVWGLGRGRMIAQSLRSTSTPWRRAVLARGLVGAAGVGLLTTLGTGRLDITEGNVNALHEKTQDLSRGTDKDPFIAELFLSDRSLLAPEMRRPADRLKNMLEELATESAGRSDGLKLHRVRPEDLEEEPRMRLKAEGLEPVRVTSRRDEVTEVRTAWSSLRISSGGRSVQLDFPDVASHSDAEFRIAMALNELRSNRRPHIAFASDTPRLSAAESHRYFQMKGLIPQQGKDEYSQARALLEQAGFRVSHVNPERGRIPDDIDLLVWIQPRRPMERMLESMVDYLYRGGRVLLAAQHFNIQPQQFRGSNFDFVYWPRPQTTDIETNYFPEVGIDLVREVLFDSESLPVELESQVNATERRDFKNMRSALPFLVRAAASRFASDSPVTSGLGDQAFIWASFLDWDAAKLEELGITAEVLMTTSPMAWTLDWSGGFIPEEALQGPEPGEDGSLPRRGPLVLAALFEGRFPWPKEAFSRASAFAEAESYGQPEPVEDSAPGKLLILACSELFKDSRLAELAPDYRGDQLLLDAVAAMALDEELASVLSRRPVVRGFGRISDESRMRWRAVIGLGAPLLYLLFGFVRGLMRRRVLG